MHACGMHACGMHACGMHACAAVQIGANAQSTDLLHIFFVLLGFYFTIDLTLSLIVYIRLFALCTFVCPSKKR